MQRLHRRVVAVWIVGGLLRAAVLGLVVWAVVTLGLDGPDWPALALGLVLAAAFVARAAGRYRRFRFAVENDALRIDRGVLTHVTTLVPFVRVQHIDTRQGPLSRQLGLASVVIYTAGSRQADVRIPGLAEDRAEALQQRLRELAVATGDPGL